MRRVCGDVMRVGRARVFSAGTAVVLAVLLVAGCGTDSGDQSGVKGSEKECANTAPKVAESGMGEPGKIAFSKDGDIYTMNPDGSEHTDLTAKEFGDDFYEVDPAWSPDGERIAFASDKGDDFDFNIYVMDSDGTGVTRLTDDPGDEVLPRWAPDGKKIGFSGGGAVSTMNADGMCVRTIRKVTTGDIGLSDWSPGGEMMVVGIDRSSTGGEIDTYVMDTDGRHLRQLTDVPGDDSSARWSPDGKKMLFGSNRNGGGIYLMNPDGTDQTKVLKAPSEEAGLDTFRPTWSPDGKQIAWTGKYEGDIGTKIYVMNADGSGLTTIHGALAAATSLDW